MPGRAIVYDDAEVLEHDALGLTYRIGNARVFVGKYVPMHGTTVHRDGDRGRLVLPRWFVEQHGLPVSRHDGEGQPPAFLADSIPPRYLSPMPPREDVEMVPLATRIPDRLRRAIKLHCVRTEQSVMGFVAEAITEKLAREEKRRVG